MPLNLFLRGLVRLLGRHRSALGLVLALGLLPTSANALCILGCSCTASVTHIVFSSYNPLSSGNVDSTGTIKVDCSGGVGLLVPYTLAISAGNGNGGSFSPRKMQSGSSRLDYNLFLIDYTTVLGNGSSSTVTIPGGIALSLAGISTPQTWTIYGRIPGGQKTVAPGTYTDTLTVTLTYI